MEFNQRLKDLRESRDLTQVRFAEILNMTSSTISKYERGDLEPNNDTIIKIADFFDVSVDYLLGRTNDKNGSINITTIAAHSDNDLTEEEREKVREFAKFLKSQRK